MTAVISSFFRKHKLALIVYGILLTVITVSVVNVGYLYMLDNDEVSHAQIVYLIMHGLKPYVDFFSVYPTIFHWFLIPVFSFSGFTLDAFNMARIVMIMLFLVRIIVIALITARV